MNKHIWSGITIWGIFVTCFGLGAMNPRSAAAHSFAYAAPDQEVVFLLAGGIVTCVIGVIGLIGIMGWLPNGSRQSGAAVPHFMP